MHNYTIKIHPLKISNYTNYPTYSQKDKEENEFSLNSYFLKYNQNPFYGVSGEFHYSRYDENKWEDELIKMKVGGINIVSMYVLWIHHEEIKGEFDWSGNNNLRKFVLLCKKHDLYVFIRIGPFAHSEARNGGLPDWLFGRPFELRSNDKEYLYYANRFYYEISKQVKDLMFKDNGPIIGTQIENEYMHAGAPAEHTTGVNFEWLTAGNDGESHIKKLKSLAIDNGFITPYYTATAWGGAICPVEDTLPVWGGYAYQPWIFHNPEIKKHPATPEYIFRDYHNNSISSTYNFEPRYNPGDYPYLCCEMGGGMFVSYKYRFVLPPKSIDAMAIIKAASGCNLLGYYLYHGGSHPLGKKVPYLNEYLMPKISYDFQAAIGEYGQIRPHHNRLKLIHYMLTQFQNEVCPTITYLPDGALEINPCDTQSLRYAVRANYDESSDLTRGFVFINNFQDHIENADILDFSIKLDLDNEILTLPSQYSISIESEESCILPFNFNLSGILLKYSTTQLITRIYHANSPHYYFFSPAKMDGQFAFEKNINISAIENCSVEKINDLTLVKVDPNLISRFIITSKTGPIYVVNLPRKDSLNLWKTTFKDQEHIIFSKSTVIPVDGKLKFESYGNENIEFSIFPNLSPDCLARNKHLLKSGSGYKMISKVNNSSPVVEIVDKKRCILSFCESDFINAKEVILQIEYEGDIGNAFIDGKLINDNYNNGEPWEIGLSSFKYELIEKGMYIYISPVRIGNIIKSDTTMAGISEIAREEIAKIKSIKYTYVYELEIT